MSKQGSRSKAKLRQQGGGKPASSMSNRPSNGVNTSNGANRSSSTTGKPVQASSNEVETTAKNGAKAASSVATKPATATPRTASGAGTKPSQPEAVNASLHRPGSKQQRRQQKMQNRVAAQKTVTQSRRMTTILVAAAVVVAIGLVAYFFINGQTSSSTQTIVDPNFQPVDGVYCDAGEQLSYHIHVLLTIYINGQQVSVPQGVGIAPGSSPSCYYWLHTHDTSGVVHIESPTTKIYSLQNFIDIWQSFEVQQISFPTQLASSNGWTVYVNGKVVTGGFKNVGMNPHDLITIMYNSPNAKPVTTYSWAPGL
jgi:hypothetical protein